MLHVLLPCAGLGVVDPEQLLTVDAKQPPAGVHSSNGGNGSSNGSSLAGSGGADRGRSAALQQKEQLLRSDGSSSTGSDADSEGEADAVCDSPAQNGGSSSKGAAGVVNENTDWGLLQLDLSFAWRLEDKPVENVEQLLQEEAAVKASSL